MELLHKGKEYGKIRLAETVSVDLILESQGNKGSKILHIIDKDSSVSNHDALLVPTSHVVQFRFRLPRHLRGWSMR